MLQSLVLTLQSDKPATVPANLGRATHAWFLNQVQQLDPDLARQLHEPNQQRPFTVSNLFGGGRPERGEVKLAADRPCFVRLSSYQPELSTLLVERFLATPRPAMELAGVSFKVTEASNLSESHNWAGQTTFATLVQENTLSGHPRNSFSLRFASPTVFKSQGNFMPLPLPRLVFEGLARRWNMFSSVAIPSEVGRFADECLVISRYRLQTERVAFGDDGSRGAFPGFLGTCSYSFRVKDRYWMGLIHMLAAFALYAGAGLQTTMGLGQVRKL